MIKKVKKIFAKRAGIQFGVIVEIAGCATSRVLVREADRDVDSLSVLSRKSFLLPFPFSAIVRNFYHFSACWAFPPGVFRSAIVLFLFGSCLPVQEQDALYPQKISGIQQEFPEITDKVEGTSGCYDVRG
jgi:hypothetical protein